MLFEGRNELKTAFLGCREEFNALQGTGELDTYKKKQESVSSYLLDLLEFRVAVREIDGEIDKQLETAKAPISPMEDSVGGETLRIEFAADACASVAGAVNGLAAAAMRDDPAMLVKTVLACKEHARMRDFVDGRKFQKCASANAIMKRYFEKLAEDLTEFGPIQEKLLLDGMPIESMSPGTRAEAMLKLFLHDGAMGGECVYIVVDQPEDNLDTGTISGFLIDRIKAMKLNVQIFIVSHSAPVVVNGDARNVVVCKQAQRGRIEYKTGTINGPETKRDIAKVLDGGERYLKMRLNKYNFHVGDKRC